MEIEEKLDQYIAKWKVLASDYELEKYQRKACEDAYYDFIQLKQSLPLEQEKVEVPEFVAEWIEKNKLSVRSIFWQLEHAEIVNLDVDDWIEKNESLFVDAMVNGYTVKKEPEWVVAIPGQEAFSGNIVFSSQGVVGDYSCNNETRVIFKGEDKKRAEAVALLICGEIVPVEEI